MKSAVATRFCGSRPLPNLEQSTPMLDTLIRQYLNKLVERKVGDFASPQALHTVKVQGFNGDCIKAFTKFACQLPLKVFALVRDFTIQTCELPHTPPPAVRTFYLTAQCFGERPKLLQVGFQRLRMLFLFTRAQRQICVFHAEVCPNAFTCCRQQFCFYKVGEDVEPIVTAVISFYGNSHAPATYHQAGCQCGLYSMDRQAYTYRFSWYITLSHLYPLRSGTADTLSSDNASYVCQCDSIIVNSENKFTLSFPGRVFAWVFLQGFLTSPVQTVQLILKSTIIILHFFVFVISFFYKTQCQPTSGKLKHRVLVGRLIKFRFQSRIFSQWKWQHEIFVPTASVACNTGAGGF